MKLQTLILSLLLGLTHAATCPYSSHTATRGGSTAKSATEDIDDDSSSIVAELFKKAYQVKKGNVYAVPSRRPSRREIAVQKLQIYMLQHPDRFVTKRLAPILAQLLAAAAGAKTFEYGLPGLRAAFGQNFCASSAVVLSEWDQVVKDLTSPQARTNRLGAGILNAKRFSGTVTGGRNTFVSIIHAFVQIDIMFASNIFDHHCNIFDHHMNSYFPYLRRVPVEMECMKLAKWLSCSSLWQNQPLVNKIQWPRL